MATEDFLRVLFVSLFLFQTTLGTNTTQTITGVEWSWKSGNSVGNQHTQAQTAVNHDARSAVDSHPKGLYPGSRAASAVWKDSVGNVWQFGGEGYNDQPTSEAHLLNDLWLFSDKEQKWSLKAPNDQQHKATNKSISQQRQLPKPRKGAVACGVDGIMLVIVGGEGTGKQVLFDTWIFTIREATWLPLYVHKENPQHPPARSHATSWCFDDKLVIYSGVGVNDNMLSDMWEFSLRSLEWKQLNQKQASLKPRAGSSAWTGKDGWLYLFAGSSNTSFLMNSFGTTRDSGLHNDFWRFSIHNESWQEVQSVHVSSQWPSARQFCCHWRDTAGNFWLSHGMGYSSQDSTKPRLLNDVWMYDRSQHVWINTHVISHDQSPVSASISTQDQLSSQAIPTSRFKSAMFTYENVVYMFGGFGYDGRNKLSYLNDIWMLVTKFKTPPQALQQKGDDVESFLERFTPGLVFLITMASTASVACVFGMVFCLKKTLEYPSRAPSTAYNVRYQPLKEEANLEMS